MSEDDLMRLKETVAETLGVDVDDIDEDSSPATIGTWTSFNHLTLMSAVEQAFGLTLTMEEMTGIKSFKDLIAVVDANGS